jgi:hypothetical protein
VDASDREDEDERRKKKRHKSRKDEVDDVPHCDINFVKGTDYSLLAGDTSKCWGTAKAEDPAPRLPMSRRDSLNAGDYLLIKGNSINLKSNGANFTTTTFLPEEELILTSDWLRFDAEMTGQDLVDLDDMTFLIWWQNLKPPPVPKAKAPTISKKVPATKKGTASKKRR